MNKDVESSGDVEKRQIMDFSPPSRFPLLRGEDPGAGLLTRRAEYGVESFRAPKKPAENWQAYFSHGNKNLDTNTDTWSQSYEMDENWQFGPPEEEEGTWVLVHDDYWDRRDRLRRNANPSEEISSSDARRHDRSANPESWTVWHGAGPKQDGKFGIAQLGWDATQVPGPGLGDWPNQANWEGRPPTGSTVQRKPEAPRVIRNPKEPRKPRGKPKKPRRPPRQDPRQDLLSFFKSLNPLKPKAQKKQSSPFQVQAQGALRNTMNTMMSVIRSGDERQALFKQMMTPRR